MMNNSLIHILLLLSSLYMSETNKIGENPINIMIEPNKKYIAAGEKLLISCRQKNVKSSDNLFLKKDEKILAYNCTKYHDLKFNYNCGRIGEWYYFNATVSEVTLAYRGEYECISHSATDSVKVNVTVLPKVAMKLNRVFLGPQSDSDVKFVRENVTGEGTPESPFNVRSYEIKSLQFMCSATCAFPSVNIQWSVTPETHTPFRKSQSSSRRNQSDQANKLQPNTTRASCSTSDTQKTFSKLSLDCQKHQLSGLHVIKCVAISDTINTLQADWPIQSQMYLMCPLELSDPSSTGAKQKRLSGTMKVTTGEVVNIVVGCTIGVVMVIVVVVLICKHRRHGGTNSIMKEEYYNEAGSMSHHTHHHMSNGAGGLGGGGGGASGYGNTDISHQLPSYTMRQDDNSIDRNGYRV